MGKKGRRSNSFVYKTSPHSTLHESLYPQRESGSLLGTTGFGFDHWVQKKGHKPNSPFDIW